MNKDLKQKYKEIFDIVRNELNKVDPMGLGPDEFCPIDEYDLETEMVIAQIREGMDHAELAKHIALIFSKMFSENFSENMFYDCAKNILEQVSALQTAEQPSEESKEKKSVKEYLKPASVLFLGAALTVMSFCLYYLVSPLHTAVLVLLCIADFIYTIVCACGFFKYMSVKNWKRKGVLMAVLYIPVFIVVSLLFLIFNDVEGLIALHIVEITFCAFFTGPSIVFVIIIALFVLSGL